VLRLRAALERGQRRRWIGVLIIVLLALLIAFVLVHDAEHALDGAAAACIALVAAFTTLVFARRPQAFIERSLQPTRGRAPPSALRPIDDRPRRLTLVPLRL
jgi:hypothetical protein